MKRWTLRSLRALALAYAVVVVLVAIFQRRLLYMPSTDTEAELLKVAARVDLQPWRDAAGQCIGWRQGSPKAARRLVVFIPVKLK